MLGSRLIHVSSGSNASSLHDEVTNDLAIIAEWLKVNKL